METLTELSSQLNKEIQDKEGRTRSRTADEQIRFNYALTKILEDIWKNHFVHPDNECLINKNKNFYSENSRYRDPNLTYRMAMAAFDGLINLDMIYVTKGGYYDRTSFQGVYRKSGPLNNGGLYSDVFSLDCSNEINKINEMANEIKIMNDEIFK